MPGRGEAHLIARSQGGLGVEENLLTVCRICHDKMDNSTERTEMTARAEEYLRKIYPYWDRELFIYKKLINTTQEELLRFKRAEYLRKKEEKMKENAINTTPSGFMFIEEMEKC